MNQLERLREDLAKVCEIAYGGHAHTYASENAFMYRTQDAAVAKCAELIRSHDLTPYAVQDGKVAAVISRLHLHIDGVRHVQDKNIPLNGNSLVAVLKDTSEFIERQAAELLEARKVDVSAIFKAIAELTKLPEDDCERIRRYDVMTEVIRIREALTGGKHV